MENDSKNIEQFGIMKCIVDSHYRRAMITQIIMFLIFFNEIALVNYNLLIDIDSQSADRDS
jgi:hypothetical protein